MIYQWQNQIARREGIERELEPTILKSIPSKPIKIVTGFRRSGKSFLVQQIAQKLIRQKKVLLENVLYLNFEDFQLSEVTTPQKIEQIYEVFATDVAKVGYQLLIFDEIQNVPSWERWIRTLYEKSSNLEIILTGSNSEMLSAELSSRLAGRFIEFFLFPFSFRETLRYKKITIPTKHDYRNEKEIKQAFDALPEVLGIPDEEAKLSYLKGVLMKVVLDDVVKRFKLENIDLIERLLGYLMANPGTVISYQRLSQHLENMGVKTKTETIIKYTYFLTQAFALMSLSKLNWKQHKIFSSSQKYYSIDPGLLSLYRPHSENLGRDT